MLSGVPNLFFEIDPPRSDKPALAFLQDYWDQKRGSRAMPARADINPADLKKHIRAIVLVEALPDFSDFRYRMIGTDVTDHMLGDATGKTVREAFARYGQTAADAAVAGYAHVARNRVVMRLYGSAGWLQQPHLDSESIHLPLSDDGVTVNMILSAVLFEMAAPIKPDAA